MAWVGGTALRMKKACASCNPCDSVAPLQLSMPTSSEIYAIGNATRERQPRYESNLDVEVVVVCNWPDKEVG